MSVFFTIHTDLPREGPGCRESLDWAMSVAQPPRNARICDAGCGPGADVARLLDHAPEGDLLALDLHPDFIERVARGWAQDGRVTAHQGDMATPGGPFDLIWSAGAVYHLGVTEALRGWRGALAPGGRIAFSELVWTTDAPAVAARSFWQAYPAMTGIDGLCRRIDAADYRILGERLLPQAAWRNYYDPLSERVARLREGADAELAAALDETEREIAVWRAHGDDFGYLLCVVEPR